MLLEISKADLLEGVPGDQCGDPIALALMRNRNIRCAQVFPQHAYITLTDGRTRTIALPEALQALIHKFDAITLPEKSNRLDPRNNFKPLSAEIDMTEIDVDPFRTLAAAAAPGDETAKATSPDTTDALPNDDGPKPKRKRTPKATAAIKASVPEPEPPPLVAETAPELAATELATLQTSLFG